MIKPIVGPPLKGVADFASSDSAKAGALGEEKKAGSDSFSKLLKRDEVKATRADSPKAPRDKTADRTEKRETVQRTSRDERDDKRAPESEQRVEKLQTTNDQRDEKKTEAGQRQEAILKFMDSFESEFGVPPTKIVEAMAKLDPSEQAQAPEETSHDVIGQLGLDKEQTDRAEAMYVSLLSQLAQINNQKPTVAPPPPGMGANGGGLGVGTGLMQERANSVLQKRDLLNNSLEGMNQKFWMKGGQGPQAAVPEQNLADKLAQMSMQQKLGQENGFSVDESMMNPQIQRPLAVAPQENPIVMPEGNDETVSSPDAALAALVAAARSAKNRSEMKELGSQDEFSADSEAAGATSETVAPRSGEAMQMKAENLQGAEQTPQKGSQFSQQGQHPSQEGFGQAKGTSAKGEIQSKDKSTEKADFKKILGAEGMQVQGNVKQDIIANVPAAGGMEAQAAPTKTENEANIRQIMNQAQYLIKKGGGEMKVQMSPEGMGKINMKVLVENGKVNVQMSAETQEAKKTLESSLSDLKNSLAAHKLSMDHVKIDVVNSTNTDNSAQNQLNQQGGREQTRQFWNNFSENFGSPSQQRDGFTDMGSLKGYQRRRSDQALEPVQTASVNKYAAAGKGKGLNLVA